MVAATPQMCWDVSIVCGKCVGGGVLLGRMLRSCTRFQVFARMTCCWSEKSCCYVSKTRASLARNAYCKTNMSSSAMPFTIPPVLCQNTIRYHHFDSLFEKYEKKTVPWIPPVASVHIWSHSRRAPWQHQVGGWSLSGRPKPHFWWINPKDTLHQEVFGFFLYKDILLSRKCIKQQHCQRHCLQQDWQIICI